MEMRDFTKYDWQSFAGCEDATPRINADPVKVQWAGREWEASVIQDGPAIDIYLVVTRTFNGEEEYAGSIGLTLTLPTPAVARVVVAALPATGLNADWLRDLGFTTYGEQAWDVIDWNGMM